jgi:hypothetical protein
MIVALIAVGVLIVLLAIAGVICHFTAAVPNMKPLTEEERGICQRLIQEGKAFPFVCRQATKTGKCICLPCTKLEQAKGKQRSVN